MFKLNEMKDKYGNILYQKDNSIYLYLNEKKETRKLGAISPRGELFIRRYNKHIFRKLDAYGFNYNLMKVLNPKMKVIVKQEDGSELQTTVAVITECGDCAQFVQEGFELQVFLPRNLFTKK